MAHHYLPIVFGMTVTTCPNPREIVAYLPAVKPTWFFAVPRIFEKLKAGLEGHLRDAGRARRSAWLDAARERGRARAGGRARARGVAATAAAGEEQLFAGLRAMLGLDEAIAVNAGAAPTPRDVLVFFHAIGVPLAELWGMSETCGVGAVNPPERIKIGTVGPPSPGVEARLADDGELLVRGDAVMAGYRNRPEQTAEALDADGWLHTGDIAQIDEDGYIAIVDRKKEIIINAAGKNMSPANIESTIKGAGPVIGHICAIGDRRPYNTALVVLDADFAPALAARDGIEGRSLDELAAEPAIVAAVQEAVDKGNAELARVEQIKKFTIIPGDWAPGGEELTPTMKLKRRPIAEKLRRGDRGDVRLTRLAVVSGGNRGIGLAVVRDLAARGFTVIQGARDPDAAPEVDGDVHAVRLDVTDGESIGALADGARAAPTCWSTTPRSPTTPGTVRRRPTSTTSATRSRPTCSARGRSPRRCSHSCAPRATAAS